MPLATATLSGQRPFVDMRQWPGRSADPSQDTRGISGAVVALEVGTQGQPEPRFSRYPPNWR